MKQVHPNYTFNAATKTITLTGLNIAQDQLLLITNATRGVIYYNFASSSHRAVVTPQPNTTVVLTDASTTGHANSDQLVIHYEDQSSGASTIYNGIKEWASNEGGDTSMPISVNGTVTANAGSGTFAVSASSLPLPSGAATSALQTTGNSNIGATNEAAASTDTATSGLNGLLKRLLQHVANLITKIPNLVSGRIPVDVGVNRIPVDVGEFLVNGSTTSLRSQIAGSIRDYAEDPEFQLPVNQVQEVVSVGGVRDGDGNTFGVDRSFPAEITSIGAGAMGAYGGALKVTIVNDEDTGLGIDSAMLVSAASLPLPSGAATSALQTTANTSLSNLDTDLGALADSAASSDTGSFSLISLFKRLLQRITTLIPANLTVSSTRLLVDGSGVTQPVSGTVTANVPLSPDAYAGTDGIRVVGNGSDGALRIGGYDPNNGAQLNLEEGGGIPVFVCGAGGGTQSLPISGTVTVGNSVTIGSLPAISGTVTANVDSPSLFSALENYSQNWNDAFPVAIKDVIGDIPISGTVTANLDSNNFNGALTSYVDAVSNHNAFPVEIAYQPSVTIGSLPAISGTVTANLDSASFVAAIIENNASGEQIAVQMGNTNGAINSSNPLDVSGTVTVGNSVTIGSCVTHGVRLQDGSGNNLTSTSIGGVQRLNVSLASAATPGGSIPTFVNVYGGSDSGTVRAVAVDSSGRSVVTVSNFPATQPVSIASVTIGNSITIGSFATSVTARLVDPTGTAVSYASTGTAGNPSSDVISIQGVSGGTSVPVSISSVTIGAVPNGALTTRFGSVTTANTAQISSAVTNTSRKYLLIQNVTTSSNVITVGIGFTPTTTQGIQLAAGDRITFESSYIPTGAVYILSSVTASPFTILEA